MSLNLILTNARIAVLYLARKAEGLHTFKSFINSYKTHNAGISHDLVVIFKGFNGERDIKEARDLFAPLNYSAVELNDEGFDFGSYFETSKLLQHEYVFCLNTFSEILAEDWLAKLFSFASLPDVGIVGATGTYEGLQDSIAFIQKVVWFNSQSLITESQREKYFKFIFGSTFSKREHWKWILFLKRLKIRYKKTYEKWWEQNKRIGDIEKFCQFPQFPNPHIRSNAFMIKRDRFLACFGNPIRDKWDACGIESGHHGMTRRVIQTGLRAIIVGKNGIGFDVREWPKSNTFRLNDQTNLLIADNQTRSFSLFTEEIRLVYSLMSWGESNIVPPEDFPDLEMKFEAAFK